MYFGGVLLMLLLLLFFPIETVFNVVLVAVAVQIVNLNSKNVKSLQKKNFLFACSAFYLGREDAVLQKQGEKDTVN